MLVFPLVHQHQPIGSAVISCMHFWLNRMSSLFGVRLFARFVALFNTEVHMTSGQFHLTSFPGFTSTISLNPRLSTIKK